MAEVGHMMTGDEIHKAQYDEYGNKQGMSTGTKTALAGVGLGALGAHQLSGSRNVATNAAITQQRAEQGYKTAKKKWRRAADTAYDARVGHRLSPGPVKLLHRGKVKRTGAKETRLATDYEKAKTFRTNARNANTAEAIAGKVRNKRIAGAALLAGGALTAASPLFRRKQQPAPVAPVAPVAYAKSDVSKTITQARYGGNVEAGRAWRGEDRKDVPKELHVIGAGGTAAAGGVLARQAGKRRLKNIKPIQDTKAHEARHAFAVGERAAASTAEDAAHGVLSAEMKGHRDYLNTKGRRRAGIKHPSHGAEAPGYRGLPARAATSRTPARPATPAEIVGTEGGGFGHRQTHLEGKHAHAKRTANAATLVEDMALKDVSDVKAANATRAPRIAAATRLKRGGTGVAALGGLAALGAAAKIEHDRRTGAGKPRRPQPVRKDEILNMRSKAKKKKSSKLSGMGDWKTHAESQDVGKGLVPKIVANSPASLPFEFGVAATKQVTPRPIRNVVRSGRNRYVQGAVNRSGMTRAEAKEYREAQQMMLRNRGYA